MTPLTFEYDKTKLASGYYVTSVDGRARDVMEYMQELDSWYPTGVDYDPFKYSTIKSVIEVYAAIDVNNLLIGDVHEQT